MKTAVLIFALLFGFKAFGDTPYLTHVPIKHIYVPAGFHDHQDAEVIVSGYMPNLCHKSPKTEVVVEGGVINIQAKALYYQDSSYFCPQVLVPFVEVVNVGLLDKGLYQIVGNAGTPFEKRAHITIKEYSSDAIDDYVFANVHHVEKTSSEREILLKGHNPSDCFELDRIEYSSNEVDTFNVYPIMRQVSDFCPKKKVPFEFSFVVPTEIIRAQVLLHVKAMDGRSVNKLYRNFYEYISE